MVAAALILAGAGSCGQDDPAGDPSSAAASSGTTSGSTTGSNGAPTFYEDVAPIVYERCLSCHVEGGIAPFTFATYEEARPFAEAIRAETAARTMPPFHIDNGGDCNTYLDARWLTDAEIATLAAWVDGGALEGNPANAPALPEKPAGLANVSATLDIGDTYTPDATLSDDYRCFLADPGVAEDTYLTAYEVKPGDPRVVHHVVVYSFTDAAAQAQAEALDAAEPGPGYTCFGGAGASASFVVGWAPGIAVTRYPEGTGLLLHGGRKVAIQVHYNLSFGPLPDRTTVDVELAPSVDNPAGLYAVVNTDINLPPGMNPVETTRTFDNTSPVPMVVHGVFPHLHTLGRTLRLDLENGDASTCLVNVPDWNFHWQQFYMYTQPIVVQPGGQVRIDCTYDTRGQTAPVQWGEGTGDEMCAAGLYVTPQ